MSAIQCQDELSYAMQPWAGVRLSPVLNAQRQVTSDIVILSLSPAVAHPWARSVPTLRSLPCVEHHRDRSEPGVLPAAGETASRRKAVKSLDQWRAAEMEPSLLLL